MENIPKKILETYTNVYLGPFLNKKERFQETSSSLATPDTTSSLATPETTSSTSTTPSVLTSTTPSVATSTSTSKSDKLEHTYYTYDPITTLIAYIMFFFAIYLSFRCNNGFSVWGFLGAFLFSPIYILYKLTSTPKMCNFIK